MRELKFRVWDKVNGRYCTGIGIQNIFTSITRNNGDPSVIVLNSALLSQYDIEQYTWLKDKNGKETYEGDIVKVNGYGLYKVFWRKWDSSFSLEPIDVSKEAENKVLMLCEYWEDEYKVIGNIHENPELLDR